MSKRFITALLVLLFMGVQAFAQSSVSGKVTDQSGEPLVGVNVLVKGTTNGTMTDLDGSYSLSNIRQGAVLVFSSIGYAAQEINVGSQRTINVQLKDDAAFLDEVVVVGYGTARKKDVSGAIASVNYGSDNNIASLPNPNATYVLDCYPTQNATTSNTLYERTRKYGWGHENDVTAGRRETYVDALGNTRHIPNIQPYNYVLPIPIQIIQSNKDVKIPQNYGYGE